MKKALVLIVAVITIIGMTGGAPLAAASQHNGDIDDDEDTPTGEQVSAVVGVQNAEIDGEIEERSFGIAVANAESDDERAEIIAEKTDEISNDIERYEEAKEELTEKYESDEITTGEYRSSIAKLEAETKSTERVAGSNAEQAGDMPEDVLENNGVNVEAIQTLQQDASNLTGDEVSEIAQEIGGQNVGQGMSPDHAGPPSDDEHPGQGSGQSDTDDHPGQNPPGQQDSEDEVDEETDDDSSETDDDSSETDDDSSETDDDSSETDDDSSETEDE